MLIDAIKNKYEVILGFVTVVISLSAFKDELAKVHINIGILQFTLADYFLMIIYGFSICLYFYVIEQVARDSRIGGWRLFDYMTRFAFFLFVLILLSPLILIIALLIFKLYELFNLPSYLAEHTATKSVFATIISIIATITSLLSTTVISSRLFKQVLQKKKEVAEEAEIIAIEMAGKLLKDGYYSHSILESFKALETHLYKKLLEKNIRVSIGRFDELLKLAVSEGLIDKSDVPLILDLRGMRNAAAHADSQATEQLAQASLDYVKKWANIRNPK
jgi:hypothetical protein